MNIPLVSDVALGTTFSGFSKFSALNNCMPPTLSIGKIAMAITITPIPPSHCKSDLQTKIPGGEISMFTRIVDPVVVIPDIDSKKESVKLRFILLK